MGYDDAFEYAPEQIERALSLASSGWAVFPCGQSKIPLTENGHKDATTDAEQIATWWGEQPKALIGVVPGSAGFTVVDVDDKPAQGKFGTQSLEVAGIDLPAGFVQPSMSKTGKHHWFKGSRPSANGYLKDVDIKSEGGYVVVPYDLPAPQDLDVADLPAEFHTVRKNTAEAPYAGSVREWHAQNSGDISPKLQAYIDRLPEVGSEFWTHEQMLRSQVYIVKCGAEGETGAADALETVAAMYVSGEWDTPEYENAWNTALSGAIRNHGGEAPPKDEPLIEGVELGDDDDVLEVVTIPELLKRKTPEWWIENIIQQSTVAVIAGEPGVGKSFLMLDWAARVATGKPFDGRPVKQGKVLYVVAEGAEAFGKRVQAWQKYYGDIPEENLIFVEQGVNMSDKASMARTARTMVKYESDIIILDTLSQLSSMESENDATQVAAVLKQARDLRRVRPNSTVLIVHHVTKDGGKVRGSSAIRGNADTIAVVKGTSENFTISTKIEDDGKQKDGEPLDIKGLGLQDVDIPSGGHSAIVVTGGGKDADEKILLDLLSDGEWHKITEATNGDENLRQRLNTRAKALLLDGTLEKQGNTKGTEYRKTPRP